MFRYALTVLLTFMSAPVMASSFSECEMLGVVEDILPFKAHFRPLKVTDVTQGGYDPERESCNVYKEKILPLYDDVSRMAGEPCEVDIDISMIQSKLRTKLRDVVQKGDMMTFDYTYYSGMTQTGPICIKTWKLKEHVPINPHSR